MELTSALALLVAGLLGWLLYERSKKNAADALNANAATKEKVDAIQKDISTNDASIEAEKQKQDELKKNLDKEKSKDVSNDDLVDYFNKSDK